MNEFLEEPSNTQTKERMKLRSGKLSQPTYNSKSKVKENITMHIQEVKPVNHVSDIEKLEELEELVSDSDLDSDSEDLDLNLDSDFESNHIHLIDKVMRKLKELHLLGADVLLQIQLIVQLYELVKRWFVAMLRKPFIMQFQTFARFFKTIEHKTLFLIEQIMVEEMCEEMRAEKTMIGQLLKTMEEVSHLGWEILNIFIDYY